jgi:hypothetical protein
MSLPRDIKKQVILPGHHRNDKYTYLCIQKQPFTLLTKHRSLAKDIPSQPVHSNIIQHKQKSGGQLSDCIAIPSAPHKTGFKTFLIPLNLHLDGGSLE